MAITFIEGADMSEAKTPLPGEYWVSDDGSLIRIVGVKLNGGVIYENQAGFSFQFNSMIQWRHEPRCTGFDWVEPKLLTPGEGYELLPVGTVLECGDEFLIGKEWVMTGNYGEDYSVLRNTYRRKIKPVESWPKYYRGDNWCSINAYVRFDDEYHEAIWVAADGTERVFHGERFHTIPERIEENSWREITEAEALGRVKPESDPPPFSKPFTNPRSGMGIRKEPVETLQQLCEFCTQPLTDDGRCLFSPCVACDIQADIEPVESPDDWVEITDGEHVIRAIDQVNARGNGDGGWSAAHSSIGSMVKDNEYLIVRCRRRDLPAAEYNAMLKKLADQNPPPQSWYDGTPELCVMCGVHSVVPGTKSCSECMESAIETLGCPVVMTGNAPADTFKITPVESPDDWVEITNRDHKLRAGIDEFRNSHEWAYVRDSHGKTARQAGFLNVRCRRKDLPVLVTPEPCAMCGDVSCDCDCYKYAVEATGCPVESPDDWVEITNSDHKLRAGIDEFRNARGWAFVRESHGKTARQAGFLNVRCRRKDLPVPMTRQSVAEVCTSEPVKTPNVVTWGGTVPSAKRVPVRLFLDDRNNMFAIRGEWPIIVGTQIKHDANGFYLEGEE